MTHTITSPSINRRPATALGGVLLAAVLATACTTTTAGHPRTTTPGTDPTASSGPPVADVTVVERPGYGPVDAAVGDPAGVITGPTGAVVTYAGALVVQACSVLTVQDIRAAGALVVGSVTRRVFDGVGTGALDVRSAGWGLPSDTNSCDYPLTHSGADGKGAVLIVVHQPGYTDLDILRRATTHSDPAEMIGPVAAHPRHTPIPDTHDWQLSYHDMLVELSIDHPQDTVTRALLVLAAQRLVQLADHPTGPPRWQFDSSAWTGDHAHACTVLSNADTRTILGVDPSPLATEWITSAVGRINFATTTPGGDLDYNHVTSTCRRSAPAPDHSDRQFLQVEIDTYEAATAAELALQFLTQFYDDHTQLGAPIGDGTLYYADSDDDATLVIRARRTIVRISYDNPTRSITDDERIRTLTPIAQHIADQLGRF